MEDKIKTVYTGAGQKERLDQLNEMYEETLERMAKSYSEIVGGILEDYGVSGEKEKICQSFKNGVEQKVTEYRDFLEHNKGFTGLEGTGDAWLLKDDEYIAAMLRSQNIDSESRTIGDGEYSLNELDILGQYVSSLSAMAAKAKATTYEMSEEQIGLELAMLTMKTDVLNKDNRVSSALSTTLQKAVRGYLDVFLEQFNHKLETNRKNALIGSDIRGNAELDKNSVWSVYNKTMEHYRSSGNLMEALIKGAEYGRLQYSQKMSSGDLKEIYRYKNSGFYWNEFFGNRLRHENGYHDKNGSTYEQYMMGWLDFKSSLDDGDSVRMNLLLRSVDSYSMNQKGNWVSENA